MAALRKKGHTEDKLNVPFFMGEVARALAKSGMSSPGKDGVCYTMIMHLTTDGLNKVLTLCNKVWEEGRLPTSWKEAVIVSIRKPGKKNQVTQEVTGQLP